MHHNSHGPILTTGLSHSANKTIRHLHHKTMSHTSRFYQNINLSSAESLMLRHERPRWYGHICRMIGNSCHSSCCIVKKQPKIVMGEPIWFPMSIRRVWTRWWCCVDQACVERVVLHCTYLSLVAKQVTVSVVMNVSVFARYPSCVRYLLSFEQAASSVQLIYS